MKPTAHTQKFHTGDRVTWVTRTPKPISGTVLYVKPDLTRAAYRDYDAYGILFDGYEDWPFDVYAWGLEKEVTP